MPPDGTTLARQVPLDLLGHDADLTAEAAAGCPVDDGDVLSLGRHYRSKLDRLHSLDEKWLAMADDARCWLVNVDASKFDVAAAAHGALLDSERLFLSVFRRRSETVSDIAVMAVHAFMLLDRGVDDEALGLARRALADIATAAAKAAGLDFSAIGSPGVQVRLRACRD